MPASPSIRTSVNAPLRGSVPAVDQGLPLRVPADQLWLGRNVRSGPGPELGHVELDEPLIGVERLPTRLDPELVAQRADAGVVRAQARRAISDEGGNTHERLIPGLGQADRWPRGDAAVPSRPGTRGGLRDPRRVRQGSRPSWSGGDHDGVGSSRRRPPATGRRGTGRPLIRSSSTPPPAACSTASSKAAMSR